MSLTEATVQNGELIGPIRYPRNEHLEGETMHSDAVAKRYGFRGGAIAGGVHLDLFPPLLVQTFGERWLQEGTLSIFFRNAILDGEPVRARVALPPAGARDAQVAARAEREDGMLVGEGTASAGDPGVPTALQTLDLGDGSRCRIFAGLKVGDTSRDYRARFSAERQVEWLQVITERMPWYEQPERWGGLVVPPSELLRFTYHPAADGWIRPEMQGATGFWGAVELRYVSGPVFVDRDYVIRTRIAGLDEGGKTELAWLDNEVDDLEGRRIAETRILLRVFKASSPLWADGGSAAQGEE